MPRDTHRCSLGHSLLLCMVHLEQMHPLASLLMGAGGYGMVLSSLLGQAEGSRSTGFTVWGFRCHNLWLCLNGPSGDSNQAPQQPLPTGSSSPQSYRNPQTKTTNNNHQPTAEAPQVPKNTLSLPPATPPGELSRLPVCFTTPLPPYRPQRGVGAAGGR